ncbi:toxin glutamine deamidase domain-containing protein [Kitasatospora sp. NPDC059795]|uniref:toxin glutamine deamidase domain-containing protein n=1 Tax=Kitasatospora sp. NPDC059795 TaxID=3346949 RepID=UPI00364BB6E1
MHTDTPAHNPFETPFDTPPGSRPGTPTPHETPSDAGSLRPDSAPAGVLRPDAEPAGLFGPKKPLITPEGLTPEGRDRLHKTPEGPSLVYPPSSNMVTHAGKAVANKFKSELSPELKNVSGRLTDQGDGSYRTESSTASGKPNAKIKDHTYKAYLDPKSMVDLETGVNRDFMDNLREAATGDKNSALMGADLYEKAMGLDYRSQKTEQQQADRRQLLKDLADLNSEKGTWIREDRVEQQLGNNQASATEGVDRLLNGHQGHPGFDGMVLGEVHGSSPSWPFLKDNMAQLKASGVDTVYLEALRDDAAQHHLDKYLDPNSNEPMSADLRKMATDYDRRWNAKLTDTLEAAKQNNVRVQMVDGYPARTIAEDGGHNERARLMNSYAHDAITADAPNRNGKYLVVLGEDHAHSKADLGHGRVPGTADLLGIPSVRLTDGSGAPGVKPPTATSATDPNQVRLHYLPVPDNHSPSGNPAAQHPAAPPTPGGLGPVHPDAQAPHGSSEHLGDSPASQQQHDGTGRPHEQQPNHEQQPTHEQPNHEQPNHEQPSHEQPLGAHEGGGPRHPATDGRPYDVEGGLKRPEEHEAQQLRDAVPHNADGSPQRHPDPFEGDWVKKLNGDGLGTPGRANNCADAALSVVDTYDGRPTVAAPRTEDNSIGEKDSRDRIEHALGGKFEAQGKDQAGHDKLAKTLLENGHGSQAVIISRDADGRPHAWNAMNHNGKVVYMDGQMGRTSHTPLYAGEGGLFALPLTPDRAPLHPSGPPAGAPGHQAGPKPDAQRPDSAPGMTVRPEPELPPLDQRPTIDEKAKLHQDPSGPALIYPPSADPSALAQHAKDNRFKFTLSGDLALSANSLPQSNLGRHHSGSFTEGGTPDVKVSPYSQSFKSHLDPLTLKALHSDAASALNDGLRAKLVATGETEAYVYPGNKLLEHGGKLDYRTDPNFQAQRERHNVLERLARQDSETTWHPVDGAQVQQRLDGQASALDGVQRLFHGDGANPAHPGIVLGEAHGNSPSWKFLKENMAGLKEAGVDTIYIESLRDDSLQRDLDTYLEHGGTMPPNLERMLRSYDKNLNSPEHAGLYETVVKAQEEGVRVRAVDGYPARKPDGFGNAPLEQRARMLNSYMHDAITSDRVGQPGKYILVTGEAHVHEHPTTAGGGSRIPGTAEMLGAPSVRLTTPNGANAVGGTAVHDLRLGNLPAPQPAAPAPHAPAQHPGGNPPPGAGHENAPHHQQVNEHAQDIAPANPAGLGTTSHEQPSHEQPSHEQPSHEQPSHEQSSHEQPSHERSLTEHEGDGPRHPATDGRPFDVEGGLKRPSEHDLKQLQDAVPHNADGSPQRHPDPMAGDWVKKLNGDGPGKPGRANNCADAALSVVDTYDGRPTVAAPRVEDNSVGEKGSRDRIEQSLGGKFESLGKGPAGHEKLAQTLIDSGPGSQAVIISRDGDGRLHAWNAMNHDGKVVYVDGQMGRTSDKPLYPGEGGLFAVPLTPDRAPLHPSGPPTGDSNRQAGPRPDGQSGAPVRKPGEEQRPGASPGATDHAESSQHTDGTHQTDQQDTIEQHGDVEHPPVTPEPLPPVGTPERGIMENPAEFLQHNQVGTDFVAGVKERMPKATSEEVDAFLKAIKGRDDHWFVLQPKMVNGKPSGYHLVPAWEKYVAHDPNFLRPESALPPVKEDHEYVKGAYVPYEADKRPDPSDPKTIGHTEVPFNPHPDQPRKGLVFTDAMNGCALVTTVEPGKDTFTAWHFQSYSSPGYLEAAYKFRKQHTVTAWMGHGDYAHSLTPGFKPAATNMLKHGPNGWEMISQDSHTYTGTSEVMKQLPPTRYERKQIPFDVTTQTPGTVVKMTLDPYHVIAQERLDRFQLAAHDLTAGLNLKDRDVASLRKHLADMNSMLETQNKLVKGYNRPDATLDELRGLSNELNQLKGSRQRFLDENRAEIERLALDVTEKDYPNRTGETVLSEFGFSREPGKPDWVDHMAADVDAQIKKRDGITDPAGVSSPRPPSDPAGLGDPAGTGGETKPGNRVGNSIADAVAQAKKAEADRTALSEHADAKAKRDELHQKEQARPNPSQRTTARLADQERLAVRQDELADRQADLTKRQNQLSDKQWRLAEERLTSNDKRLEPRQTHAAARQERWGQQQERLAGQQDRLAAQYERMSRHEALADQGERAAAKQQGQATDKSGLDVRREKLIADQRDLDGRQSKLDHEQHQLDARHEELDGLRAKVEGGQYDPVRAAREQKSLEAKEKQLEADQQALTKARKGLDHRQKWIDKSEWLVEQHGRLTEQEAAAKRDNWPADRVKALADRRELLNKWHAEQHDLEAKAEEKAAKSAKSAKAAKSDDSPSHYFGPPSEVKWRQEKQKWLEELQKPEEKWHSPEQRARLKEELDALKQLSGPESKTKEQSEKLREQERLLDEQVRLAEKQQLLEDRQKHNDGDPEQLAWEQERLADEQRLNEEARRALENGDGDAVERDPAPTANRPRLVDNKKKGRYYTTGPKELGNVSIEEGFRVMTDSGFEMADHIASDKFRPGCVASAVLIDGEGGSRRVVVVTASSTKGLAGEGAPEHVHPLVKFAYGSEGDPAYDRIKKELGWNSYPKGDPGTRCKCAEPSVMTEMLEQVDGHFTGVDMNDPAAVRQAMERARGILGKAFVRPLETGALKDGTGGRVRGYGEYKAPCDNCAPVVEYFGMKSVQLLN